MHFYTACAGYIRAKTPPTLQFSETVMTGKILKFKPNELIW